MHKEEEIKQKRPRGNLTKISEVLPVVKENLGLEKNLKIMILREMWPALTSSEIAKHSQPVYFDKENNIVVAVNSGTLAVELSMQKASILSKLKKVAQNKNITFKDVRFINK